MVVATSNDLKSRNLKFPFRAILVQAGLLVVERWRIFYFDATSTHNIDHRRINSIGVQIESSLSCTMMLLCRQFQRLSRPSLRATGSLLDHYTFESKKFSSVEDDSLKHEIQETNTRYAGKVDIRETGQYGWGLFALCEFQAGDMVMQGRALEMGPAKDAHTIQTDWNTHAIMDLPARFVNHVCNEANLGIKKNDVGAYDFHALKEIGASEELLWDYETSEYEMEGFVCACGKPNCRRELWGFRYHANEIISSYGKDFVAPYLLEKPLDETSP
jgi:hypothetical protein